jgi:hypothetical protein
MGQDILYILVDEGGNLDFSIKGTKYFTLTALTKLRPFKILDMLSNLKYDLWEKDIKLEYFHATEDNYLTRNCVINILSNNLDKFIVDNIIVEKRKTNPVLQDHSRLF